MGSAVDALRLVTRKVIDTSKSALQRDFIHDVLAAMASADGLDPDLVRVPRIIASDIKEGRV